MNIKNIKLILLGIALMLFGYVAYRIYGGSYHQASELENIISFLAGIISFFAPLLGLIITLVGFFKGNKYIGVNTNNQEVYIRKHKMLDKRLKLINQLHYKEYIGNVYFSKEDNIYYGIVVGTSDLISFEGDDTDSLKEDFHSAIDEYIYFLQGSS
ncbi:MAG: hypothetical protein FWD34_02105 [Oscillospiraceae bacterium]|nr:hypothetical protein [Oscillospiraceae bacterium]